ncbi:unnamed protein product [Prorocentrum cordatum]|uniref:Uncharacterized protein n=1 Tax=Prorocentrum cordatum TaxID=2364126 RepID=A0ABN9T0S0_9DINO|nr:unnamed protein product [Polarella glacialis]
MAKNGLRADIAGRRVEEEDEKEEEEAAGGGRRLEAGGGVEPWPLPRAWRGRSSTAGGGGSRGTGQEAPPASLARGPRLPGARSAEYAEGAAPEAPPGVAAQSQACRADRRESM